MSKMETKHTPAPWEVTQSKTAKHLGVYQIKSGDRDIASLHLIDYGDSLEQQLPNAKLGAAAPDLLEALDAVLKSYEHNCPESYYKDDTVLQADRAIRKAIE